VIGLDTNILIRYLTLDDPAQSIKAASLIEEHLTENNPGFISIVTMVETVWVLKRPYGFSDAEVAGYIELLLRADTLIVERARDVHDAMLMLKEGRGEFADCMIASLGRRAGCSHTLTFDRRASQLPGFAIVT
jgi:predicted nucleic-acid-binding protein